MSSKNRVDSVLYLEYLKVKETHIGKWVVVRADDDVAAGYLMSVRVSQYDETVEQGYSTRRTGRKAEARIFRFQGGEVMRVDRIVEDKKEDE